jgi:outer membrane protein TolC
MIRTACMKNPADSLKPEWDNPCTARSARRRPGDARGEVWRCGLWFGPALLGLFLAGCKGIPSAGERAAGRELAWVQTELERSEGVPVLNSNSTLGDYLRFAMLHRPAVRAAYHEWASSVARITVERSLPDPQLTFESDIADVLLTIMPGLMQEFPGPGKLRAAGEMAAAESRAKYFAFEAAVLQAAFELKRAYCELWFLDENIRINRQTLNLLAELERSARAQNEVGRVTLQDVYRAQIEQDQLATEIANLEDSRLALSAQFKGALGLTRDDPDPPSPARFESTPLDLDGGDLLEAAFARNPRLRILEADVRTAESAIALAGRSRVPDFSLGLMADVKASPVMFRPLAGVTLPLWRDKIAAQVERAQAGKRAAVARLTGEQINLTVDLAMKSYDYRESTRNLALLRDKLLPKAQQSLEIARAGYLSGRVDFFDLLDAERTLLNFQLREVAERTRREILLADLSLMIAGISPEGAPLLPASTESSSTLPVPGR